MKNILITLILASFFSNLLALDRNFDIKIHVKGISNQDALLAYNYGDKKYIADTIQFNQNGVAKISGNHSYDDGTYLIAFPSLGLRSFDFIIRETAFQLNTDTSDLIKDMVVKNSMENQVMYQDLKKTLTFDSQSDSLKNLLKNDKLDDKQRSSIQKELDQLSEDFISQRGQALKANSKMLYYKILNASRPVPMATSELDQDGKKNVNYGYEYYINHYWDNTDFSDVALIKSPVVIPRIFNFLDHIYQTPDSINRAIDIILNKAAINFESFKILTSEIINKYAKSTVMGQEAVYVHLLDKYYLNGKTPWVDQETLDKMKKRADAMRPTLIGKVAPDITVYSLTNIPLDFYKSIAPYNYSILVFWNSECSHCQKEMPELVRIWKDSLSSYNVGVFSVSTEIELAHVKKFVEDNKLNEGFINGYDPTGGSNFRSLYDVNSTPLVVILDKDKKIIAKKVSVKDIPYVISTYQKYMVKGVEKSE